MALTEKQFREARADFVRALPDGPENAARVLTRIHRASASELALPEDVADTVEAMRGLFTWRGKAGTQERVVRFRRSAPLRDWPVRLYAWQYGRVVRTGEGAWSLIGSRCLRDVPVSRDAVENAVHVALALLGSTRGADAWSRALGGSQ